MIDLPEDARKMLTYLREMSEGFKNTIRAFDGRRDSNDNRDQALAILAARAIRLADAFCILCENGYGEAASASARALHETQLFMRWVIKDCGNAQKFFDAAQFQGAKIARLALKHEAMKQRVGASMAQRIEQVLASGLKGVQPPKFVDVASAVECTALHELVYPALSAMAHPNFLGLGDALVTRRITFEPSLDNVVGLLGLVRTVLSDCLTVYGVWMGQRRVPEPPTMIPTA